MPEIDGFEICRIIKSKPQFHSLPVLYLSAATEVDQIVKGFGYGAVDYITKPFNAKILLTRINTHLELQHKTKELQELNRNLEKLVEARTDELNKANQELLHLDEVKTEFLTIISHEIRTPLNGIMGGFQLIRNSNVDENMTKIFEILEVSVDRLERYALNALLITNLKTRKYKIELTSIPLIILVKDALDGYIEILNNKGIQLDVEISQDLIVKADKDLLTKCITSLLDNAVKFSPYNAKIIIKAYSVENGVLLEIIDNGEGFTPKALSNLFKLFMPGQTFVDQNEGLELALCKLIMEAHKGTIEAKNHTNGALVKLFFPDE